MRSGRAVISRISCVPSLTVATRCNARSASLAPVSAHQKRLQFSRAARAPTYRKGPSATQIAPTQGRPKPRKQQQKTLTVRACIRIVGQMAAQKSERRATHGHALNTRGPGPACMKSPMMSVNRVKLVPEGTHVRLVGYGSVLYSKPLGPCLDQIPADRMAD